MVDGYVKRVLPDDGYVMVSPLDFLEIGATYDILRDGNVIAQGLAVGYGGIGFRTMLVAKRQEQPITIAQRGDRVLKMG